jgi:hypothetical protein
MTESRAAVGAIALALIGASAGAGQRASSRLDLRYGQWARAGDGTATSYELRTTAPLLGPVAHGWGIRVLVDDDLGRRRAFYGAGYELTAFRARRGLAVYPVAAATLGLSTDTIGDRLAALWVAGGGVEWRPLGLLALGVEARYQLEDRGPRGFWDARGARDGWAVVAGLTWHWRGASGPRGGVARHPAVAPAAIGGPVADVVRTALDAIGTPYTWGGTVENGFDCSGLIQYAYAQHGIALPRRSRDQAAAGVAIPLMVSALVPGDILAFSAAPGGTVSHVGLYVGDGVFIHSASDGVRLSRLAAVDPEGPHWLARWIGARRIRS